MWEESLKRGDRLEPLVTPVIDDDVYVGDVADELPPELRVNLITDEDIHPRFLSFTFKPDIDSIDAGLRSEVLLPHVEAASPVDSDLDDMNLTALELLESDARRRADSAPTSRCLGPSHAPRRTPGARFAPGGSSRGRKPRGRTSRPKASPRLDCTIMFFALVTRVFDEVDGLHR